MTNRSLFPVFVSLAAFALSISLRVPVLAEMLPATPGADGYLLVGYSASTGEIWFDDWYCTSAPQRSSPRADRIHTEKLISSSAIFTNHEAAAEVLSGPFDRHYPERVFKLDAGGWGDVASFGRIAETGLSEEFLVADLRGSGAGTFCGTVADVGLSYFPTPNLKAEGNTDDAELTIIYKAGSGEIAIDVPDGVSLPWIGFYSASGIFDVAADQREIDSRIQYRFDVTDSRSFANIAERTVPLRTLLADLSVVASDASDQPSVRDFDLIYIPIGDLNEDTEISAVDIDLLTHAIRDGNTSSVLDVNGDGLVDGADRVYWIENVANTYIGDSNLDGEFNTADLTAIFQAGEYLDDLLGNSTWGTGDWNGDGDFTSSDLVMALADGGYAQGPRASVAVPEPNTLTSLALGLVLICSHRMVRKPVAKAIDF
jgi:hypothetical protein